MSEPLVLVASYLDTLHKQRPRWLSVSMLESFERDAFVTIDPEVEEYVLDG